VHNNARRSVHNLPRGMHNTLWSVHNQHARDRRLRGRDPRRAAAAGPPPRAPRTPLATYVGHAAAVVPVD